MRKVNNKETRFTLHDILSAAWNMKAAPTDDDDIFSAFCDAVEISFRLLFFIKLSTTEFWPRCTSTVRSFCLTGLPESEFGRETKQQDKKKSIYNNNKTNNAYAALPCCGSASPSTSWPPHVLIEIGNCPTRQ
jgi:hypothetical protein